MKLDRILVLILVLSIAVSLYTVFQRLEVEKPYNRVELVADYDKFKELADDMGISMRKMLEDLKASGVTSVALKEETVEKMEQDGLITAVPLWQLNRQAILGQQPNAVINRIINSSLDPSATMVMFAEDKEVYNRLNASLKVREVDYIDWSEDGTYAFTVPGRYEQLKEMTLGFDYGKFEMARDLGLNISARPNNFRAVTPDYIEELFTVFERYGVTSIIFDGLQALGYPDNIEATAGMVKKTGIVVGPIETWMQLQHIEQKGLPQLIELSDYKAVRVFSLNEAEANKVSPKEVMDRWFRAVDERNLRLVYLKPKIEDFKSAEENFETNKFYIEEFSFLISRRGFSLAPVRPMPAYNIGSLRLIILAAGIVAGGILLLMNLFNINKKYLYALFIVGIAACAAIQYLMPSWGSKIFALGAAVVFPSLAMVYAVYFCKGALQNGMESRVGHIIGKSVLMLLKVSAISLIGASYVASILSSTNYLLEMDIFRGVKLANTAPLGLFVLAYFIIIGYRREEHKSFADEVKDLINIPVSLKYVIFFTILGIAGYMYIARAGHTAGAPIFSLEVQVRTFMEQYLAARPRTKEFLIAHPAMVIMVAGVLRKYKNVVLPLGLAAAVGQASMVNSFSHLRTPLYMSFYRTVYGLGFGIVLGIIGIIILGSVVYLYKIPGRSADA